MARRKALTADQWQEVFQHIIVEGISQFGRAPCLSLEVDEDGVGAVIVGSITRDRAVKKLFDCGRGKITTRTYDSFEVHIYKKEISDVLRFLVDYQQPEPDFEANLDYWAFWMPPREVV
jgi:hypothetical protein